MTCKMILLSPWKEEMTSNECIEHLNNEHTQLVRELPDLNRFTTAIPHAPDRIGYPFDPDGTRYDLMAEFYFDSREALKAAFESEEGRRVRQDAHEFVDLDESVLLVVDDETLRYQAIPSAV